MEPGDVSATLSLARYIRDYAKLTGTKVMCNQAGCGACVVTAEMKDPNGVNGWKTKSVNTVNLPKLVSKSDRDINFPNCFSFIAMIF